MKGIDDFSRPEEYISPFDRHFRRVMRNHLETWVMPERRRYDEDWKDHRLIGPAFDRLMVDLGLQKALFPQEHGGWGLAKSDSVFRVGYMLCEELGRADTGMAVALAVTFWPLIVITVEPYVNDRLIAEFAPMFCNARKAVFAANAMTEPQGGADIENLGLLGGKTIRTTARLEGDQWVKIGRAHV